MTQKVLIEDQENVHGIALLFYIGLEEFLIDRWSFFMVMQVCRTKTFFFPFLSISTVTAPSIDFYHFIVVSLMLFKFEAFTTKH